jgi:hypothetical protein
MIDLGYKGFLSPNIDSVINDIRESHRDIIALCENINELAHSVLRDIKIDLNDKQHLLVSGLFIRAMTTYQGVVILALRGMPAETSVVLRTLLEVLFRVCAIAKNVNVADAYIGEDEIYRRKSVYKLTELGKISKDAVSKVDFSNILNEIKTNIEANGIKERSTEWYAKMAGLEGFYLSAYSVCSRSVHVNVRDLESALVLDSKGDLVNYKYGPDVNGLDISLLAATESMIYILDCVRNLFGTIYSDKVDSIYQEYKNTYNGT